VSRLPQWLASYEPGDEREQAAVKRVADEFSRNGDLFDRSLPLHVTGSALVVDRATRRLLLRWHARQGAWLHVGGHGDTGETEPLEIALREAGEETGLADLAAFRPGPAGLVPVHIVIVVARASASEPEHEHADVRYLLATSSPETACAESPSAALRWLSPAQAIEATDANLAATIRRAGL
jgi:8-oxo-dGTP pyrophosphatase MutT (NUDIX family)